jgi:hypothetical protein
MIRVENLDVFLCFMSGSIDDSSTSEAILGFDGSRKRKVRRWDLSLAKIFNFVVDELIAEDCWVVSFKLPIKHIVQTYSRDPSRCGLRDSC